MDGVALVTGATGGIGQVIVRKLHALGYTVGVHAHKHVAVAQALVDELGEETFVVVGDVERDAEAMIAVCSSMGELVAVVNNAASQPVGSLLELSGVDVAEVVRINLLGVMAITQAAAKEMIRMQTKGAICNISSIEAFDAPHGHSHYAATKAAIIQHGRAAAVELGGHGIRVNSVAPGLIDRPGLAADWPHGVERWTSTCPLGTLGTGTDVAEAVAFLVGDASRWITGTTLVIDGGMTASSPWS
jgi:NAD(P)-dependent dehydrogenase (short-subunit alcohol dehydrogenase family)